MSGKGKWLCAGTAWATREIGMTQPTITIALGAERNTRMIIITYHRSTSNFKSNYLHNANGRIDLGDGRFLYTFLTLMDENRFHITTHKQFKGLSNPLTQLKVCERKRYFDNIV